MLMKSRKVNIREFAEFEDAHTAAYVNANDIGNYLVAEITGEPDYASCTGMNVRHDSYFLVGEHINREQLFDLRQSILLNVVRKNFHVISFYYLHDH